jgi:hypothetical protein
MRNLKLNLVRTVRAEEDAKWLDRVGKSKLMDEITFHKVAILASTHVTKEFVSYQLGIINAYLAQKETK